MIRCGLLITMEHPSLPTLNSQQSYITVSCTQAAEHTNCSFLLFPSVHECVALSLVYTDFIQEVLALFKFPCHLLPHIYAQVFCCTERDAKHHTLKEHLACSEALFHRTCVLLLVLLPIPFPPPHPSSLPYFVGEVLYIFIQISMVKRLHYSHLPHIDEKG